MRRANIIVSLILIAISVFFLYETTAINQAASAVLGPRFFPYVTLGLIIVLSFIVMGSSIRDKENKEEFINKAKAIKVGITLVLFIAYTYTIEIIGFIASTAVFLFALGGFYYGKLDKKIINIGIFSLITPFVLYLLFNNLFKVLLP